MAESIDPPSARTTAELASDIRTFLLAEVRDYTRFSQERGDEEAIRLVGRFARLTRQAVEARGGKVIELRGDEALAVFGSARQALRAAVELQADFAEEMVRDPSLPLRVGIGLDAGEAMPFEGGYRGRALNLAARLKDQARAGQVLATEALIHLAGQMDGLTYLERGLIHAKGVAIPIHVVQVVAEGQQPPEAEHADVPDLRTFLFADIVGFGQWTIDHGDAAAAEIESWFAQFVDHHAHSYGGRVLDLHGDEAFVVFVSPRQAIQAAMALQETFERAVAEERHLPFTLKIGLETGEAIPLRGKYTGLAVNLAARICGMAEPREVLIGDTLSRLVRKIDGLRFIDRGQSQIRGFAEPVRTTCVIREDGVTEGDTPSA